MADSCGLGFVLGEQQTSNWAAKQIFGSGLIRVLALKKLFKMSMTSLVTVKVLSYAESIES